MLINIFFIIEPADERDLKFRTGDLDLSSAGLHQAAHSQHAHSAGASSSGRRANRKRSAAMASLAATGSTAAAASLEDGGTTTTDDNLFDEFPIDPNEPTYCLCNQVSFGEMIACDNDDVIHHIISWVQNFLIIN